MADGATFEIDIEAKADSAAEAASIVGSLADQLDVAKAAATAASEAMRTAETAYKAASSAAESASKALERMNLKVDEQRAKVDKLAAGGAGVDSAAYKKASDALSRLTLEQSRLANVAAQATEKMNSEGKALDKLTLAEKNAAAQVTKVTKAQTEANKAAGNGNLGKAASELANMGGPLGAVSSKALGLADSFGDMKESLGAAGPYALIAVAIVAIGTAAVTATAAILKFAIANADAARTAELLEEQAKGGAAGLAATQKLTLSLDAQSKKLSKSIASIFSISRPMLEKLLEGLSKLVGLFDENSITAQAMQSVFRSLFDPLVEGIVAFIPKMVSAFIQFEILVLKAIIAIKPWGETLRTIGYAFAILAAACVLAIGIVVGILVLAVAQVALFVAAGIWLQGQLTLAFNAIGAAAVEAFDWIRTKIDEVMAFFSGLSLSEIGTNLMLGLADGITGAAGAVLKAMTGAVQGAIDGAKSLLGIASPSKVFAEIGGHTAEGMAVGVDEGASDVQGSLEAMVAPPAVAPSIAGASAPSKGGSPAFQITINGVTGAEQIVPQLIAALEGWVTQSGGAVASAA